MQNWIDYIDTKFAEFEVFNLEENTNSFYPNRNFRINGTYIFFEFIDIYTLKKIECGHYQSIENDQKNYSVSNAKIVFNKHNKNYFEIIEYTYNGEDSEKYELIYTAENEKIINEFLKIPIENGWLEKYYKYKNAYYKIVLEILNEKCEIILSDVAQQDLPLPGDKFSNKIKSYILDLKINSKHREVEIVEILPFKKTY